MDAKNTARVFPGKSKDKRPYGKAPLELDLPQALEAVGKISQEGKSLTESKLALVLGNTITSSAFARKVRSLAAYGLVDQSGGQFTLTELALAIAYPRSALAQADAKKQAFLKIEQFAFLFNQHKGKLLPADEFLRNIFEQECSIPRDVSQAWVKHFKDGARTAGLFHNRGDGKIQIAESPMSAIEASPVQPQQPSEGSEGPNRSDGNGNPSRPVSRTAESPQPPMIAASGHCTRIELSDGRRAEINIPDRLSVKDAQKLQKALDGVRVIIESLIISET